MLRYLKLSALVFVASTVTLRAQYYFYNDKYYNSRVLIETGISAVAFNCLTDLGGGSGRGKRFTKDINWENTRPGASLHFSATFDQVLGLRLEVGAGTLTASDQVLANDFSEARLRYLRNLHFRSRIYELLLMGEFHPLPLLSTETHPLFSGYVVAGIGLFRFNPQARVKGAWVDLQPLSTEGQGFKEYPTRVPYNLVQLHFPLGLGVKYELSALVNLRMEILYRVLRTDYLDDVSTTYIGEADFFSNLDQKQAFQALAVADRSAEIQPGSRMPAGAIRGNPDNRDSYFSGSLKLGIYINRKHR